MRNAREKELQKLKEILAAKLAGPKHVHFLKEDDDVDLDVVEKKLVEDGVITPHQQVTFIINWRWPGFKPSDGICPVDPRVYGRDSVRDTRSLQEAVYGSPIPSVTEEILSEPRHVEPESETPKHLWKIRCPDMGIV
jgi:hypothetical protein